ncbi:MAG: Bax inhibitor-1/YccA family protein [Bacteroidetes bacterium]|nr:Bax inhibitor-1/YccA family protein [Bacteroidota bacterium]
MSNPLFSEKAFSASRTDYTDQGVMTLNGTINKSILLFATMLLPAAWLWFKLGGGSNLDYAANNGLMTYAISGMVIGLISSLVMMFKKSLSPYLAPIYAAAEGLFLGAISMIFESAYEGIVMNAIGITLLVFAAMLLAYRSGLLRATPMFTKVIVFATMGVGVFYLITMIMGFFGVESFYYGNSPVSIGISALIAGIAAFNLILDFSFIEQQSNAGAPKYMEWFSGVALLMTLVWLYLEILRLLAKLQSRD